MYLLVFLSFFFPFFSLSLFLIILVSFSFISFLFCFSRSTLFSLLAHFLLLFLFSSPIFLFSLLSLLFSSFSLYFLSFSSLVSLCFLSLFFNPFFYFSSYHFLYHVCSLASLASPLLLIRLSDSRSICVYLPVSLSLSHLLTSLRFLTVFFRLSFFVSEAALYLFLALHAFSLGYTWGKFSKNDTDSKKRHQGLRRKNFRISPGRGEEPTPRGQVIPGKIFQKTTPTRKNDTKNDT
jgi:hypothetical protein